MGAILYLRCDETPHRAHRAHRTTSRRELRDVLPLRQFAQLRAIRRIQRFLLIELKPKHVFRCGARGAVFRDTRSRSYGCSYNNKAVSLH